MKTTKEDKEREKRRGIHAEMSGLKGTLDLGNSCKTAVCFVLHLKAALGRKRTIIMGVTENCRDYFDLTLQVRYRLGLVSGGNSVLELKY